MTKTERLLRAAAMIEDAAKLLEASGDVQAEMVAEELRAGAGLCDVLVSE
jgi:hypothetical protein